MVVRSMGGLLHESGFADLLDVGFDLPLASSASAIQPLTSAYESLFTFGTSASQTLNATSTKPYVAGLGGDDTINGDNGDNFLVGDDFDPSFIDYWFSGSGPMPDYDKAMTGNDVLSGGDGDDFLIADSGDDTVYGGAGWDEIVVSTADIGKSEYFGGGGSGAIYFEDVFGRGFSHVTASRLIFDDAHGIGAVYFWDVAPRGTSGNDVFNFTGAVLFFYSEDDDPVSVSPRVDMGAGNDKFLTNSDTSEESNFNVFGNAGNDTLFGNRYGRDTLDGGTGADVLVGEYGSDTYYVDNLSDVVREEKIAVDDGAGGDTIRTTLSSLTLATNVENLIYTGSGAFSGTGNNLANHIFGGAKADVLSGGAGADTIEGGLGGDTLTGGTKADVFVFNTALGGSNVDALSDFSVADDTIWLEKTGAGLFNSMSLGALPDDKFKVYGTGAVDGNDRILYDSASGKIYYDADGSGAAGRILFATLTPGTALTAADFLVI